MEENRINGRTQVCGLIGNPVEHTKSPLIQNGLAARLSHNLVYVPFQVKEDQVKSAVEGGYALGIQGINVTIPHKSRVIEYLVEVDSLALRVGAVNTLVKTEGGYKGYNTDLEGLFRAMKSDGITLEGESVMILGAGGGARAAAFLCARENAARIYILNRTMDKAVTVASDVNQAFDRNVVVPMALSDYRRLPEKKFLAIQATGVGLYPNVEDVIIEEPEFYERIHTGYDLIYTPENTKFMEYVRRGGGKAFHGLKMLLYQAVFSYELWNHVSVEQKHIEELYRDLTQDIYGRNV